MEIQLDKEKIISIITPSYNQGEYIEETIKSVLTQEGDFYIDYIIMDGGSNDQTVDIIKKYENLLKEKCDIETIDSISYYVSKDNELDFNKCRGISYRWVSEKDSGQADAINRGIGKSIGQVIGWLNSDDVYYPNVFKIIVTQNFKKYDFFYGKGMWISKIGKNLLPYPTYKPSFYSFFYQCTLCQPAVFFTKKVVQEIGLLNNDYYCGFDFEYWMRALYKNKKFLYIDSYFAKSRMYMENKSLANQDIVSSDINIFKEEYFKKIKLDKNELEKFKYINEGAFNQVKKLKFRLETGEKINILFDASVIINDLNKDGSRSGIFFVALNVLKFLSKKSDVNIYLYCNENQKINLQNIINNIFQNKKFIILTNEDLINNDHTNMVDILSIDVYLSPIFKIAPEIKKYNNIIKYTILYDLIPLLFSEYFPIKQCWYFEMINGINMNDYYFAISEKTKDDFISHITKIDHSKVKVIPLAASDNFYNNKNEEEKIRVFKKYNIPINKKYIFSLCTLEPRKNLIMSVKSFIKFISENKITDLVFLLGGSHWDGFIEKLKNEIDNLEEYKDKIIRVGYIDDEDLSIFYSFSEFFVYPSLYEGFGLPVLEAMKCGVPVITSNNSSLPEVIGDAGIMVDPKSEKELVDAFGKLYFNDNLKIELSKKGLERAKMFSWEKTVGIMIEDMVKSLKDYIFEEHNENDRKLNFIKFNKNLIKEYLKAHIPRGLKQPLRKAYYFISYNNSK